MTNMSPACLWLVFLPGLALPGLDWSCVCMANPVQEGKQAIGRLATHVLREVAISLDDSVPGHVQGHQLLEAG